MTGDRGTAGLMSATPAERVLEYHRRTKHRPDAWARSPGYLDWETQPDPFRRFEGPPLLQLPLTEAESGGPTYDSLFSGGAPARSVDRESLGRLFYNSLVLPAWKQAAPGHRWSLRTNPSSGDLHPTEAYLVTGPVEGLCERPGVFHYSPLEHAMELRMELTVREWEGLAGGLPSGAFLLGLASIWWRESWKYGERAFRYCHLDAAAAGLRGTGIGCFFDDLVHEVLGLEGAAWQSVYHFTAGGAVDDPRLRALHPYFHKGKHGRRGGGG